MAISSQSNTGNGLSKKELLKIIEDIDADHYHDPQNNPADKKTKKLKIKKYSAPDIPGLPLCVN